MDDRTTLATMSLVELNKGTEEELIGIMLCAVNRFRRTSKKYPNKTLYDLIDNKMGGHWTGGDEVSHRIYMKRMEKFLSSELIDYRLVLADMVLGGMIGESIGKRECFLHPSSKAFDNPSPKRPMVDPDTGRFLPSWSIAKEHGGQAKYPPLTIGITRFS